MGIAGDPDFLFGRFHVQRRHTVVVSRQIALLRAHPPVTRFPGATAIT